MKHYISVIWSAFLEIECQSYMMCISWNRISVLKSDYFSCIVLSQNAETWGKYNFEIENYADRKSVV